jgi:hypothetical protein
MDTIEPSLPDDLNDLERRLKRWQPSVGRMTRDEMLFEAGQASTRTRVREGIGLVALAASMLVSLGLGLALARERARREGLERILAAQTRPSAPLPPLPEVEIDPNSYLALSHRMATGLDDWPAAPRPSPTQPEPIPPRVEPPITPLIIRDVDS